MTYWVELAIEAVVVAAVVWSVFRTRGLTAFTVLVGLAMLLWIGYISLDRSNRMAPESANRFGLSVAMFAVGYFVHQRMKHRAVRSGSKFNPGDRISILGLLFFVAMAATYHYSKVGIPLLSGNVEAARWDLASSGLVGIPSRIVIVGATIPVALAVLLKHIAPGRRTDRHFWWLMLLTTGLALVSGFRGALFELLLALILAACAVRPVRPSVGMVTKVAAGVLAAGIAAFAVGGLYTSNVASDQRDAGAFGLVAERATVGFAQSGWFLLSEPESPGLSESERLTVAWDDSVALLQSYLGQSSSRVRLNERLSNVVAGVPADFAQSGAAPSTPGLFPYLWFTIGVYGLVVCFIAGAFVSWIELAILSSTEEQSTAGLIPIVLLVGFMQLLLKGSVEFLLLNWPVTAAIITVGAISSTSLLRVFTERALRAASFSRNERLMTSLSIGVPIYDPDISHLSLLLASLARLVERVQGAQICVVDDSEQALREEILTELRTRCDFTYRWNRGRLGMAENWSESIRHSNSQFALVVGQDDLVDPEGVYRCVELLQGDSSLAAVAGQRLLIDHVGAEISERRSNLAARARRVLPSLGKLGRQQVGRLVCMYGNCVGEPGAAVVRTSMLNQIGGFGSFEHAADVDTWLRLAEIGPILVSTSTVLHRRLHSESATSSNLRSGVAHKETLQLLDRLVNNYPSDPVIAFGHTVRCLHSHARAGLILQLLAQTVRKPGLPVAWLMPELLDKSSWLRNRLLRCAEAGE